MILGAVLAGGRSTRFGSDKARVVWNGLRLLDHVVAALGEVATMVVVCGRDDPRIPSIADRPAADLGPLAGLNAALHHARQRGIDHVVTAPCDTPTLDAALLAELAAGRGDAFLAEMPVIGRWRSAAATMLDDHLAAGGNRSMRGWAERIGATPLEFPPPPNINRPADLDALADRSGHRHRGDPDPERRRSFR